LIFQRFHLLLDTYRQSCYVKHNHSKRTIINERIRAIGKQLGITDPEGKFYSSNYEALAEAIVQECLDLLDLLNSRSRNSEWDSALTVAETDIKQHFNIDVDEEDDA
jgi:hypothetical protein